MEKRNLILIHSYPTNSILLHGVIEYLEDYFNVFFIDLPGFTKAVPPLETIHFDSLTNFVHQKVVEFDLDDYLIGGISFGFFISSKLTLDEKCKGVLAIEPYTGKHSLKMSLWKRIAYSLTMTAINRLHLHNIIWGSSFLRAIMARKYPEWTIDIVLSEIDARTFFIIGELLLKDKTRSTFLEKPHVLLVNPNDNTVDYVYLSKIFSENVGDLLTIHTTIEHYPDDLSKQYFEKHIPDDTIQKVMEFLNA